VARALLRTDAMKHLFSLWCLVGLPSLCLACSSPGGAKADGAAGPGAVEATGGSSAGADGVEGGSGGTHGGGTSGVEVGGEGGGTDPVSQKIGDLLPTIEQVVLAVNIDDGFGAFNEETYTIDVGSRHVAYSHTNGAAASAEATPAQMDDLVAAIRQATWWDQPDCMGLAVDGAPLPPELTVRAGAVERSFGVSGNDCASSDHSAFGDVISCTAFAPILDAVLAILPGGVGPSCESYW